MKNKKPELLSPAGSFMSAYYAYQAGADAVYLGLTKYSARKTAQNFNNNELLKLKKIASDQNKKIYIAINTIIRENEIEDLITNLQFISKLDVDAVIVQDFGVIELLRKYFPDIPIHASTQMAIHNELGIEKAVELGIKRIIFPREMPFNVIKNFKKKFNNIEFEVFIHGSLCYSYSGLCLNSGLIKGRSGNRGECTQPCRNIFSYNGEKGNCFSAKDLFLGKLIHKLMKVGVESFKIEGRQKNPEYIFNVVKLYRHIIDALGKPKGREYENLLSNSGFVYTREKTRGYILGKKNEKIITEKYARNIGTPIGVVKKSGKDYFSFKTNSKIIINDVLLFFLNKSEETPYKIPLRIMEVNNKKVSSADKNTIVKIESDKIPEKGQTVFKAYSKDLELPGITHRTFPAFRKIIPVEITLIKKENIFFRFDFIIEGKKYFITHQLISEKNVKEKTLKERLQDVFSKDQGSFYEIRISGIANETAVNPDEIFLPGTMLKGIVKVTYQFIEKIFMGIDSEKVSLTMNGINKKKILNTAVAIDDPELVKFISKRENLNIKDQIIPFYTAGKIDLEKTASHGKYFFIPLKPIVYDIAYYSEINKFIKQHLDKYIFLGINNIHHLKFLESLVNYENVYSFIDFYFYAANSLTLYNDSIKQVKVIFAYYWIEGSKEDYECLKNKTDIPLFKIGSSFSAPLFLHDGSFVKESFRNNIYKKSKDEHIEINDKENRYKVFEKDGFSYLFKD